MQPIPFGPFQLTKQLDAGGMGEVWEGIHVQQHVPVAVKVIGSAKADDDKFRQAFVNEVRAVAGLNHPGIPMVLDFGQVHDDVEVATQGRIKARAPYLVMELLGGGSLKQRLPAPNWEWVKTILFSLLNTLAYAHARGVLHRDIKPANILFAATDKDAVNPKLIDFGLASLWQAEMGERRLLGGTPAFQAPEQILTDRIRDQGPWTDLYALGCLTFAMACGRYPFKGQDSKETLRCHITRRIPGLTPVFPVPDGLNGWVHKMMAKSPKDRFRRAADAAHALSGLGEAYSGYNPWVSNAPQGDLTTKSTVVAEFDQAGDARGDQVTETLPDQDLAASTSALFEDQETERFLPTVPILEDWHQNEPQRPSMQLVGAGLTLYGLRRIPIIDREDERSALWRALAEVFEGRKTRIALLRGPSGTGKSRLAEWLCARAHEVGVATSLKAVHSPHTSPGEGLARMIDRFLNCVGLDRPATRHRIAHLLNERGDTSPFTRQLLLDFIRPKAATKAEESSRQLPVGSYHTMLLNTLRLFATRRCLVVWLDDVQWGADAIAFARRALDTEPDQDVPILFLMTVQDEALAERELEANLIEQLTQRQEATHFRIGPLPPEHRAQLVNELLNIEGDLAKRVDERTRGNPLFAVQLVGDWVGRGVLEVGKTGFELRAGEKAVIPDELYGIWLARVRRVLETTASGSDDGLESPLAALELAAVLGQEVDQGEWEALCKLASTPISRRLVDGLCVSRLANRTETGWQFVHSMLRESMERSAREAGRLVAHHDQCAQMLQQRYSKQHLGINERIGQHLIAAGQLKDALAPLSRAARERLDLGMPDAAIQLIKTCQQTIDALKLSPVHPERLRVTLLEVFCVGFLGRKLKFFGNQIDSIIELAEKCPDPDVLPSSLHRMGVIQLDRGQVTHARELGSRALETAARLSTDHPLRPMILVFLGQVEIRAGNLDQSWDYLEEGLTLAAKMNDQAVHSRALSLQSRIAAVRGDLDTAFALIDRAMAEYEEQGSLFNKARCLTNLSDFQRYKGNLDAAFETQKEALEIILAFSPERAGYYRLNLSLILFHRGRYEEAEELLKRVIKRATNAEQLGILTGAICVQLAILAKKQRWEEFAQCSGKARELTVGTDHAEYDSADTLERAGDLAAKAAQSSHAKAAYSLALQLWQKLEIGDRVEQIKRKIKGLN